jgi:uncharacterized protein GlcG (DUF336 family)
MMAAALNIRAPVLVRCVNEQVRRHRISRSRTNREDYRESVAEDFKHDLHWCNIDRLFLGRTAMHRSYLSIAAGVAILAAASARAAAPEPIPAPPSTLPPPTITLAEARAIIDGAIAYARERNTLMAVTVVDTAGNTVATERMDGVAPNNVQYAEGKAFAAAMQRQTTEQLSQLVKDRPDRYFAIMAMNPGKMYLVGGGEPLILNGVMVGAVGVAGLALHEDEAAGRAGMAAWLRMRGGR